MPFRNSHAYRILRELKRILLRNPIIHSIRMIISNMQFRSTRPAITLTGAALLQSRGGYFGDKAYLCVNGSRRYIPSLDRLAAYGVNWPEELTQVTDQVLSSYSIGGWLPAADAGSKDPQTIRSGPEMREFMASGLKGFGLEVGAGASPFPVPVGCRVIFGDRISHEQLVAELYPGQQEFELVRPDVITDFDDFDGIGDESLDFIIGCHVIEHVFDPIGTLVNAHRKLRPGGKLLLVVPDKGRTFDRERPTTTLAHLIEDHNEPSPSRDRTHYEEFYRLAFKTPEADLQTRVDTAFAQRGDLHVHVWDYLSFTALVSYVNSELVPWSNIWSQPALADKINDIEFYFVLTK